MASPLQQFPFISSLKTPSPNFSPNSRPLHFKASPFNTLKVSSSSSSSSSSSADASTAESSSAGSVPDDAEIQVDTKSERLKLAFHRAKDYRKNLSESNSVRRDSALQARGISDSNGSRIDDSVPEQEEDVKISEAPRMAMDDKRNKAMTVAAGGAAFGDEDNSHSQGADNGKMEIPEALRIAMEKAKEYKKNKGMPAGSKTTENGEKIPPGTGSGSGSETGYGNGMRIGNLTDKPIEKKQLKISSIDFMGLDFSEKKNRRGLPPGLLPVADPYAYGETPEVEIIVGDPSKFDNMQSAESKNASEDTSNSYKPKVSTWGVFPRPSNISKTFGGGRNLHPGEALETPEDRAAKEARTRKLLAEYKAKIGLNIHPKLKAECEKNLREGDALMDIGKLKEALPYYQKVMDNLVFQSELYGLAALQWSICQDSLSRPDEALAMYKKLKSHSNAQVSKKARQFVSSFEAMDMMKVRRAAPINPGYQPYFEAFIDEKTNYSQEKPEEEGSLSQALPYLLFLASPIVLVLLFAVKKGI